MPKRTIIVANGDPPTTREVSRWWQPGDRIIAADGGARHALALGLTPHVVVGDMDSLDAEMRERLARQGSRLVLYPAEKDETDLELALLLAVKENVFDIVILGALERQKFPDLQEHKILELGTVVFHSPGTQIVRIEP